MIPNTKHNANSRFLCSPTVPRRLLVASGNFDGLTEELGAMFRLEVEEIIVVVVPAKGPPVYRALPDSAEVRRDC